MAYDIKLEGKNMDEALQLLEGIAKILDTNKIQYWLEGGTLLGIRRENRLLPWDNDVDLSMMNQDPSVMKNLIDSIKKAGFRVSLRKFDKNTDYFKAGDYRIIKIRKKLLFGLVKGKICLEIFVKHQTKDRIYWQIADKVKNVPALYYQTFKSIDFNNYSYQAPLQTNEYLTYRYGDWKTPVKIWDTFADDKAI